MSVGSCALDKDNSPISKKKKKKRRQISLLIKLLSSN